MVVLLSLVFETAYDLERFVWHCNLPCSASILLLQIYTSAIIVLRVVMLRYYFTLLLTEVIQGSTPPHTATFPLCRERHSS